MEIKTDPTGHYTDVKPEKLFAVTGILPVWAMEAAVMGADPIEHMVERYGFGKHVMTGGKTTPEGVHMYPGDPPMYPVMEMRWHQYRIWFYESAMFCVNGTMLHMD